MTVDEFIDLEIERGNFLSGGQNLSDEKKFIDDLDYNAQDEETYKNRKWDEFKDFNPAGWGNRYNKG